MGKGFRLQGFSAEVNFGALCLALVILVERICLNMFVLMGFDYPYFFGLREDERRSTRKFHSK